MMASLAPSAPTAHDKKSLSSGEAVGPRALLPGENDDNARQEILDRSLVYLGGEDYGLSLLDPDPTVPVQDPNRPMAPQPSVTPPLRAGWPKVDLSQAKPAATPADAEKLPSKYQLPIILLVLKPAGILAKNRMPLTTLTTGRFRKRRLQKRSQRSSRRWKRMN
jgi:hypothetical protein